MTTLFRVVQCNRSDASAARLRFARNFEKAFRTVPEAGAFKSAPLRDPITAEREQVGKTASAAGPIDLTAPRRGEYVSRAYIIMVPHRNSGGRL